MSGTCENCGESVESKNAAGHYRDKCRSCIHEAASAGHWAEARACNCAICEYVRATGDLPRGTKRRREREQATLPGVGGDSSGR